MDLSAWSSRRKDVVSLACVLFASLIPLRALLWMEDWTTHDVHSYGIRLGALVCAMREGEWLGRWCPDLDRGYGYPLFTYYPPGFYYLGAAFYSLGMGIMPSLKCALALPQLLGAAGMFFLARLYYGRCASIVCALVWAFLSYQRVNLFVRGAWAEYAALQWLPVAAFLLLHSVRKRSTAASILGGFALAALIVTHAITALAAVGLLVIVSLSAGWNERRRVETLPLVGIALSLGLSAFYWAPALLGRKFVRTEDMTGGILHYSRHFLEWPQWLNVLYWSNGGSVPGSNDGMALHFGFAPLVLCGIGWWLTLARPRPGEKAPFPLFAGTMLSVPFLFLTLEISKPLWDRAPLIRFVQFPWRFLGEVGFLMAWGSGAALERLVGREAPRRWRIVVAGGVAALVILAPPWASGGLRKEPPFVSGRPDGATIRSEAWRITNDDEFLPRDVKEKWPAAYPPGEARIVGGAGQASAFREGGGWIVETTLEKPARLILGQYWFPGWKMVGNGLAGSTRASDPHGLIEFDAPAGHSRIVLARERFGVQRAGDAVAGASAIVALVAGIVVSRRKSRSRNPGSG